MKKVLIISLIVLVLLAGGVVTGLYIIGDKIIDATIDMSIPTESDIAAVPSEETAPSKTAVASATESLNEAVSSDSKTAIAADSSVGSSEPSKSSEQTAAKNNEKPKADQPVVSVEKMQEVKEQVTAKDKVEAAAMVVSKLSSAEVNALRSMLAGGLSAEEKAKAKEIAFANFSSEEIAKIKEIYNKYMKK